MSLSDAKKPTSGVKVLGGALVVLGLLGLCGYKAFMDFVQAHGPPGPETRAIGTLKGLCTDEYILRKRLEGEGRPPTYATLAELQAAGLAKNLAPFEEHYTLELQVGGEPKGSAFWAIARPVKPENRFYFTNDRGELRYAMADDPASSLRPDPKTCDAPSGWRLAGK